MYFKENIRKLRRQTSILQNELADFLCVDIDELSNKNISGEIPMLGIVRGGPAIFADENIIEYEADNLVKGYFYLNVVGDSIKNAHIIEEDRVFIKKQNTLDNGELDVVSIKNGATLKSIYFDNHKLILKSENKNYEPMVFSKGDIMNKNIQIIGKLIHNKIRY